MLNQDISPEIPKFKRSKKLTIIDENSPPKKPLMNPRKLPMFEKRENKCPLPKQVAKRLFSSLKIINTQLDTEYHSTLKSFSICDDPHF